MNIYDLISRAQKLRKETQPDSVSPDRVGGLHEDTLKYIAEIGAVPADAELSATSTNPPQNKVVTKKFTKLESEVANIKKMVESGEGGSGEADPNNAKMFALNAPFEENGELVTLEYARTMFEGDYDSKIPQEIKSWWSNYITGLIDENIASMAQIEESLNKGEKVLIMLKENALLELTLALYFWSLEEGSVDMTAEELVEFLNLVILVPDYIYPRSYNISPPYEGESLSITVTGDIFVASIDASGDWTQSGEVDRRGLYQIVYQHYSYYRLTQSMCDGNKKAIDKYLDCNDIQVYRCEGNNSISHVNTLVISSEDKTVDNFIDLDGSVNTREVVSFYYLEGTNMYELQVSRHDGYCRRISLGDISGDEVTEVLTIYAMSMMWDLSPSIFEIPEGELTEDDMEMMEVVLAIFANNASVYNKIMTSDTPAKSYPVVIDYLLDSINGEGWCRTIIPAVLVKSLEGFRIIPADEYKSYMELIELPDFGYTISEDGGYSRKSSKIMFAIQDTGELHESLVQQNARVAKLLLHNQVNSSNVNIFFGTSSLFNAYAGEGGGIPGMSVVYILMRLFIAYNFARGKIMTYRLDSGDGAGITNEIHVSVPGAITQFDPYSSSPTFIPVVEFQQTNN